MQLFYTPINRDRAPDTRISSLQRANMSFICTKPFLLICMLKNLAKPAILRYGVVGTKTAHCPFTSPIVQHHRSPKSYRAGQSTFNTFTGLTILWFLLKFFLSAFSFSA